MNTTELTEALARLSQDGETAISKSAGLELAELTKANAAQAARINEMNDICTICGHWHGLHHFETMQCPAGGEAPIGRKQQYLSTTYQDPDTRDATIAAQAAQIQAMIETYAIGNEKQAARIEHIQKLLEDTFIAIARTGANYDMHNSLRPTWEVLQKELFPDKVTK